MTDAVVGAVCEALADELLHVTDAGDTALREFFEQRFYDEAILAMEREAATLTKRPIDTLERVRRRVDSCEPMAQLIDGGPEFIRIMRPTARRSTVEDSPDSA